MYVYIHTYIHTCAYTSQRSTLGVLFYCLPLCLRQNPSLTLELTKVMSRLAQSARSRDQFVLPRLFTSQPWVYRYMCLAVNMGVEDLNLGLRLDKPFDPLAHLLST